tara:strand:- start:106 stop:1554 length:1449 start_codon:yes stop_codon:yes gene_type:complete
MANTTETATFNVKSNIGEVSKDAASAASEFKVMGVSLNSVKAGFVSAGNSAKVMFGSIKAGIASTGIGLLVLAVGSLVSYFTNTKRGADKLAQAFTAIGTTVSVLIDRFSSLGEGISLIFSGEFSKGAELLKNSFKGIGAEVANETAAMVELKKRTQELRDEEVAFTIQKAKTRQEIEKARLNAEDETKSAAERLQALKKALELEEKTTKRELELARERMNIQKEEMALSENSAEDEAELARLQADIIEKETASVKMRRRVVTEVNALERELQAEQKAAQKEIDDKKKEAREQELEDDYQFYQQLSKNNKAASDAEIAEAKRVSDVKKAILKAEESFKKSTIDKGFGAAAAMAGENAALSKGVAAAQTIYNTQQGIMAAMGATSVGDKLLPYPLRLANAIATGVMGAAALSKIMSTSPTGGGAAAGGGASGGATATPAPQMMSGAFELGGGMAPEPVKAFVVTDEMTNSQNQLANIRRRATI